jgi:drug/metabolite transporter (DMT)-like permease
MVNQIKTKRYWLRVAAYFMWFLITYTLISAVFMEADKPFWNVEEIQSRSLFAFFMAIIFAYRHNEQPKSEVPDDDDMVQKKWTLKEFFGIFGLMLLFALLIMTVLFGIGWVVMQLIYDNVEPVGQSFTKMIFVTSVMTFIAVLFFFLAERFGFRRNRKAQD